MRKHHLDLDALAVETFATTRSESTRGSVHAHGNSDTTCFGGLCDCETGGPTCAETWCGSSCTYPCEYTEGPDETCRMTCECSGATGPC